MQYLRQFLGFVFSRQMLAFTAMVVLALVIWFLGPLIAFDGLRPLATAGVRVAIIVLLLTTGILWLVNGPVSLVGVVALCLLVWHAGPLLSLGSAKPLASVGTRTLVVGVILLICAVYWLFWLRKKLQDDAFLQKFLNFGKPPAEDNAAKEELKTVGKIVQSAVTQLKRLRSGGGLRRILEGKRYLYELPWYVIVGSPGAGKTTALLNSGLQFPVAHQMGKAPRSMALQSQGGTMHCDWWFTNEAVLIDTAGRYTTHDSNVTADTAEWRGFLGLLRKHRTRAPINGAIVAINAAELLTLGEADRVAYAGRVRDRLAELREQLGIRFPVYVIVTKLDLLSGFCEYFQSLTSEGRAQTWGFTLPYQGLKGNMRLGAADIAGQREALREKVSTELALLKDRLAAGLRSRLNEEFDVDRRRRMFALPQEVAGLAVPLTQMIDEVFLDSRFDGTQLHHTLRGVYFTSGAQADVDLPADPGTLVQRLWRSLGRSPMGTPAAKESDAPAPAEGATVEQAGEGGSQPSAAPAPRGAEVPAIATSPTRGQQGFFLQHLLTKVIIPEAHLVRPNLRWEFRFRLLRLMGHTLSLVIFLWLASALALSFGNNRDYLVAVDKRAGELADKVRSLFADFKPVGVPDVLDSARELPTYPGVDLDAPPASFRYGLNSIPPVLEASAHTYAHLQDRMLLPSILQRMEAVLAQSVKDRDAKSAYETLRVYKLLHDRTRFAQEGGAMDVKTWVLKDWELTGSAAAFGGRASMVGHVDALFSGARVVQSPSLPNEALVREVQAFLDSNTSTQRVYERAKAAMRHQAPQEFTLIRAVGPQAGTVFSRAGGLPLEKGVPGLFTYDGYHELFNKRLPEFVGRALEDDAWVMGRDLGGSAAMGGRTRKALDEAAAGLRTDPLLEDIRRQYLNEYARYWEDFLESIRIVSSGSAGHEARAADIEAPGSNLGFDLAVLRQFAAPDSPLTRLARAAAHETTLSRPLVARAQEEKSLLDKASEGLAKQTREIGRNFGIRSEERMEKQLVDDRFAALREVVTGQPDAGLGTATPAAAGGAKPGLEAISGLINEFYTLLVVADTALTANSLPPGGGEVGMRLKLEAGKLPAPFREVLSALAASGSDKVVQGSTEILRKQARLQFDRLMGLMSAQVAEGCKRGIEGRYPFAAVAQDVAIEDFTQVFAAGGTIDEYFTKYLAPLVDTSARPWRYKNPALANAMVGAEGVGAGVAPAPATTGPTLLGELLKLLAQGGPNLEAFYRAQKIRELFFRDAGNKKPSWTMEMKVLELDPTITDLVIDIDGQGQRYIHGPVQSFTVNWPGQRGGSMTELIANPKVSGATSTVRTTGPWALFRLLDKGRIVSTATSGRVNVEYLFDGRKALLDISAGSQPNPLNSDVLKGFRCPSAAI
ncbi:type VI secretion system protein ImpL [Variovorax sp. TBS-050B]|uniref:type VI secretion system membrane subunit TssM n=1 Tax=Variovorax sp. TBS-050B TaxID=2940551 RepID=UPI002475469A|nr:type VI secretion system membrane subunit TssM [Variovorax sp. TBS-050B]MDH6594211.1 type VI secretion system protein ImpL [Variovorax sp. TBS-050B]